MSTQDLSSSLPPDDPSQQGGNLTATSPDDSLAKSLFFGPPAEQLLFPYPELAPQERDRVHHTQDWLRRFVAKQGGSLEGMPSAELHRELAQHGMFGLWVPKAYGGLGFGKTGYARIVEEIALYNPTLALVVQAHSSLGLGAILELGSDELKERYLPRGASGETLAAFALAESAAGSDAGSVETRAIKDGDGYVLHGTKGWVTNGHAASLFTVFARTSPAETATKPRLTAFVVEKGPLVSQGFSEPSFGMQGAISSGIAFDGVRIGSDQVLGEVGRGFKVAMQVLTSARVILAASCIGQTKRLIKLSVERAVERRTFGRSISEYGLIRDKIAEMSANLFALESMTYFTTGLVDQGKPEDAIESAMCKVFGSEVLWNTAHEACLIAGSLGYSSEHPWEKLLRDARAPLVFEGTNEILRCFIALSGMQAPRRGLDEIASAMREPIKGFGLLGDYALKKARAAIAPGRLTRIPAVLAREAHVLFSGSTQLSKNVDKVLRRHGKNIAEMQYTQRRVADIAIALFAMATCLSRTTQAIERRGEEGARREIDLFSIFAKRASQRIEENLAAFDDNDDELRKAIAQKACNDEGYPLDIL